MCSKDGFSLVEAMVAALIGLVMVLALGRLGEGVIHARVVADSNSAAMSLAERQIEKLRADPNPNPTSTQCSGTPVPNLCGNQTANGLLHGPTNVDVTGAASSGGPYRVQWTVVDDNGSASTSPALVAPPTPAGGSSGCYMRTKKVTVTVTVPSAATVKAALVTYLRVAC